MRPGSRPALRHPGAWAERAYAGFWRRAFAFAIDTMLVLAAVVAVSFVVAAMLHGLAALAGAPKSRIDDLRGTAGWLIGVGVYYLYFAAFESSPGQATPGKRALGVYVGDHDAGRLGFVHALLRNFAKMAWGALVALIVVVIWGIDVQSDETFRRLLRNPGSLLVWSAITLLGHLMAGWTRHKQAFHDVITGCYAFRR